MLAQERRTGDPTVPPGDGPPSGAQTAEALFPEARLRRRRRWLAGAAAVLVAAAVTVSSVTWVPRVLGPGPGQAGSAGAGLVGHSPQLAMHASFTYRVVTAGIPEAHGTENITYSGKDVSFSFSSGSYPLGPSPAQARSGTERFVGGQAYIPVRVRGQVRWIIEPLAYAIPRVIDPRRLLRVLEPYAQFQAAGYQVVGGARLKVLRATDPGNVTRRDLLPVLYTSGEPVGSLTVWVDGQGVVHRMAFTFVAYSRIEVSKPVSQAALLRYHQVLRAQTRLDRQARRLGPRAFNRRHTRAQLRTMQAMERAFPIKRGNQVTTTTVTFSAIGQPQRIAVPPHALSYRKWQQITSRH